MKELLDRLYAASAITPGGVSDQLRLTREIFAFYMAMGASGELSQIDEFLGAADTNKINSYFLTAILRGTCNRRDRFQNWEPLRDRIIETLKARNENWEHVLRGILGAHKASPFGKEVDELLNVHPNIKRTNV